jgi:hypothetical protein
LVSAVIASAVLTIFFPLQKSDKYFVVPSKSKDADVPVSPSSSQPTGARGASGSVERGGQSKGEDDE